MMAPSRPYAPMISGHGFVSGGHHKVESTDTDNRRKIAVFWWIAVLLLRLLLLPVRLVLELVLLILRLVVQIFRLVPLLGPLLVRLLTLPLGVLQELIRLLRL
jgi:hypothetical protein